MQLAWLTDIHLNFVDDDQRALFLESVGEQGDAVAVCGDIGESRNIGQYLREMDEIVRKPVYFVLGNHDFYRGSIAKTRLEVAEIAGRSQHLRYLSELGPVELTPQTAIVGHDGWADGRFGDYWNTNVALTDHVAIAELATWHDGYSLDKENLLKTLVSLADEAARHFDKVLREAVSQYRHIVAVTHVPPFREAAWHEGGVSDDDHLPYFACKAVGDVMRRVMEDHPQSNLLVLCGHTHGGGCLQVLDNLRVLTGPAEYEHPEIQGVLQID